MTPNEGLACLLAAGSGEGSYDLTPDLTLQPRRRASDLLGRIESGQVTREKVQRGMFSAMYGKLGEVDVYTGNPVVIASREAASELEAAGYPHSLKATLLYLSFERGVPERALCFLRDIAPRRDFRRFDAVYSKKVMEMVLPITIGPKAEELKELWVRVPDAMEHPESRGALLEELQPIKKSAGFLGVAELAESFLSGARMDKVPEYIRNSKSSFSMNGSSEEWLNLMNNLVDDLPAL